MAPCRQLAPKDRNYLWRHSILFITLRLQLLEVSLSRKRQLYFFYKECKIFTFLPFIAQLFWLIIVRCSMCNVYKIFLSAWSYLRKHLKLLWCEPVSCIHLGYTLRLIPGLVFWVVFKSSNLSKFFFFRRSYCFVNLSKLYLRFLFHSREFFYQLFGSAFYPDAHVLCTVRYFSGSCNLKLRKSS